MQLWTIALFRKIIPGLGGFLAIWFAISFGDLATIPSVMAPLGATCVIAFVLPDSPLARPRNIIGGHVVSALVGLVMLHTAGAHPWSIALAVGLAILMMQLTDTLHPPAGANPLVVMLTGASWSFLFTPVLLGSCLIFAVAFVYHRMLRVQYPKKWF